MDIIVVGSSGRLGEAIVRNWNGKRNVIGLSRKDLDVSNIDNLRHILNKLQFNVLINCIALTNISSCEKNPEDAMLINALVPNIMAEICRENGARMVHFSTDYVFNGKSSVLYTEIDNVEPINKYGVTKLAGEIAVMKCSSFNIILRVSWLFGSKKPGFVDNILLKALKGEKIEAFSDKISCPTFVDDCSNWLGVCLDCNIPGGIYHMCNTGSCTLMEYAEQVLLKYKHLPLKTRFITPISMFDNQFHDVIRPQYSAMSNEKLANTISIKPQTWREALQSIKS